MKQSYKETLHLPITEFPMKADLTKRESQQIQLWQDKEIYKKIQEKNTNKPLFILHDGPPYANGHLHIGHALNKILKDIIIKYKTKNGFQSPYIPGWDCHGLPIEIQAQKKLKSPYSKNELRDACRKHAQGFIDVQMEEFQRLMVFSDYENRYATLDYTYESQILKVLKKALEKDMIYRGNRPVHWCISCATALADAEIEYSTHISPSLYVSFPILEKKDTFFLVWTTTPWTLISNVALSFNKEIEYGIFNSGSKHFILAVGLVKKVSVETKQEFTFIRDITIHEISKMIAVHPFLERESKILFGDHVTLDAGTGIVHTAPGHGQEDFDIAYKQNNIPIIMPVNNYGKYIETPLAPNIDFILGKTIWQANPLILEVLKEKGNLFFVDTFEHSYPHCWRCKNPIIIRSTSQWFIQASYFIHKMLLEVQHNISFFPADRKDRMLKIIQDRPDWCVSRQRAWGVPIPSVICECGEEILHMELLEVVEQKIKEQGANFWFDPNVQIKDFYPNIVHLECKVCHKIGEYSKSQDILDVWFDSAVSWLDVLNNKLLLGEEQEIDLYLEGNDQFRAWYQVSLITGILEKDKSPYKGILTHGMVLDEQGKAMSKSMGNVFSANDVCQQYGAEILRLWVVSQNYTEDMRFGKNILGQISDAYRKIRNTFRFMLSNLFDYNKDLFDKIDKSALQEVDKWVLWKLHQVETHVHEAYEKKSFDIVFRQIFQFMNESLSSFYLDVIKDPLYTLKADDPIRRSAQYTISIILQSLVDLLSPILSFTAEEVYSFLPFTIELKEDSIFLKDMFKIHIDPTWKKDFDKVERILELRIKVHKELEILRQKKEIGSNLESEVIIKTSSEEILALENLDFYFIVSHCSLVKDSVDLQIEVKKGALNKCPRCYRFVSKEPEILCERCEGVLS